MRSDKGSQGRKDLPYRYCVGVMLLNRNGQVFVGRRHSSDSHDQVTDSYAWQMPQGGIDPGEDPYQAAVRELYEETSVRSVSLLAEAPDWYTYDL
ncbi:MAG: RNA pyrophosphohydrolase, partial [Microvirga sp.]